MINSNQPTVSAYRQASLSVMRRLRKMSILAITLVVALVTILAAFSCTVDPAYNAKFAVIGLTFQFCAIAVLLLAVLWLFTRQWLPLGLLLLTIGLCHSQFFTWFPVNVNSHNIAPKDATLTLLTYNVAGFTNFDSSHTSSAKDNATMRYILQQDADIVALQEAAYVKSIDENPVLADDSADMRSQYPYRDTEVSDQVLLSKYPFTRLTGTIADNCAVVYRVTTPKGELLLVNCHLHSINLVDSDKKLYMDLTNIKHTPDNINKVKKVRLTLVRKLAKAFRGRSQQAKDIRHFIDSVKSPNVVVCGDFNDTPGSFSYATIKGGDLTDAYVKTAFGPTITFHTNRFYFKIDQILYRGSLRATSVVRGHVPYSDHYPLLATFRWK